MSSVTSQHLVEAVRKGELIGLPVTVVESGDPTLRGLAGTVVDESRSTFIVERADGREVNVPKTGQTFRFTLENGSLAVVDGATIAFAPEERTKKAR